jgi:hypothetical protein
MEQSVKIFDEYHTICRTETLSLRDANAKFNTSFPINSATQKAWQEYAADFEQLKLQENVIDGEWLTERMKSYQTYLEKHEATEPNKRKFFIGTQSGITKLPELKIENKTTQKVSIPLEEAEKEEAALEQEEIPIEDAFTTPSDEVMQTILKNKSYGQDFEQAAKAYMKEKDVSIHDKLLFVPSKEALKNKLLTEDIILPHIFPNKNSVIETMHLWKKTLNLKNNMYNANELYVLNYSNQRVKVGEIPYIFKDADKYTNASGNMYVVNLVGKRHLYA